MKVIKRSGITVFPTSEADVNWIDTKLANQRGRDWIITFQYSSSSILTPTAASSALLACRLFRKTQTSPPLGYLEDVKSRQR